MFRYLSLVVFLSLFVVSNAHARTVTDMTGRKVVIPDRIERVVGLSPPATYLIYAIDPNLLAGLSSPLRGDEKFYTVDRFKKLPVVGGIAGESRNINVETLLKVKPDVVILWQLKRRDMNAINRKYEQVLKPLGIPILYLSMGSVNDYPAAFRFLGDILNRKERAAALERYAVNILRKTSRAMAGIPAGKRVPVYYAEGVDGLATEGEGSMHTQLIPLSGGRNVSRMKETSYMGLERITMEQLLIYDPDVILVKEKACYERIAKDARWKNLRAVRAKRVYLIPYEPFNWFDRPPSHMHLLGVQWLSNLLHPDRYPLDMVKETRAFYRLFFNRELSDRKAREILHQ
ncbi:MAG: ABC transporter substrate-binding protein [Geobacteraceae bacterium]|nr:ABC transporter substrate-binding protein [Geobacteraceae bacterium]